MNEKNVLEVKIKYVVMNFLDEIKQKDLLVISHFDTDGITAATIMLQTLKKLDQPFSLKIVKSLNKEFIENLPKEKIILFLDLASGNIEDIKQANLKKVFIIDHHEIQEKIPENIEIINPKLAENQKISSSGLTYLFSKEINPSNKEFAKLAILGMIGDQLEKDIDSLNHGILEEGEIKRKRGLLIYPATRPLNLVLEHSSEPYIPGVTGDPKGTIDLLRESGISPEGGKYKSLIDLTEEEMEKLVTSVMLRHPQKKEKLIGDLFLIKMFGKLEDAREISAKINACSRTNNSHTAIAFCMENQEGKKQAESIHVKYKQELISGIKFVQQIKKIEGKGYSIINAKEKIKDTMIGTITSILANSALYTDGTLIISLAKDQENNKIKISARNVGRVGRNSREILAKVMESFEGEIGGHQFAAGCSINPEDELKFIEKLKKTMEFEIIQI